MHELVIRKAMLSEVSTIKSIADTNKATLGFVTQPALIVGIQKGWLFVAEINECIIGFVHYRHRRDLQTTIYELCVRQDKRGQGIGHALVKAVVHEAMEHDKACIVLKVIADIPANDFYAHLGFTLKSTETGRKRALHVWHLHLT